MKTIKGATGSKSVLLRKLALPFLMLVAILGIEIGGGQTAPRDPQSSIGPDIGGQAVPRHFTAIKIGGNSAPKSLASATTEIGGQNQQTPKDSNPLGIGGSQTAPRSYAVAGPIGGNSCPRCGMSGIAIEVPPIGGGQTPPRLVDIGGQQTAPRSFATIEPIGGGGNQNKPQVPDPLGIDIGGQRVPGTSIPLVLEIGGNQSKPQDPNPFGEIGGQVPPRTGGYLSSFLTDCTLDIGGNQGIPQAPLPIGGNGGGSTAPRNYKSII